MMRKILLLALLLATLFCFSSCKKEEKAEGSTKQEEENISLEAEENEEDEIIEVIYAKTPEEASDKCMEALYTGDFSGAKQYVLQEGNAKTEIGKFREGIKKSLENMSRGVSKEKSDRLLKNTFDNIECSRTEVNKTGDRATVSYSIVVPDMGGINFSSYMDEYIASLGMGMEEFMTFLESMSEEESQKWSAEFGIDIFNYIFESKRTFPKTESQATVVVENRKNGWIVTEINNL